MSAERLTPPKLAPGVVGSTGLSGIQQSQLYYNRQRRIELLKAKSFLQFLNDDAWVETPWQSEFNTDALLRVKLDLQLADYSPATLLTLASFFDDAGDEWAWILQLTTDGYLQLVWTTDGVTEITDTATATIASAGVSDGDRITVQVTAEDNGDGTRDVTFEVTRYWDGVFTTIDTLSSISDGYAGFDPYDVADVADAAVTIEVTNDASVDGKLFRGEIETDSGIVATMKIADAMPGGADMSWTSKETLEVWTTKGGSNVVFP